MDKLQALHVYIHPAKNSEGRALEYHVTLSFNKFVEERLQDGDSSPTSDGSCIHALAVPIARRHKCTINTVFANDTHLVFRYSPAVGWRPFVEALYHELTGHFLEIKEQVDNRMQCGHIAYFMTPDRVTEATR